GDARSSEGEIKPPQKLGAICLPHSCRRHGGQLENERERARENRCRISDERCGTEREAAKQKRRQLNEDEREGEAGEAKICNKIENGI
ncbi:unnamed protein product, partial [Porites lobata]